MNHSASGSHRCQFCLRRYKRHEHLKRHLISHGDRRRYTCAACGYAFSRSDALGRHSKTCPASHHGAPKSSKRRACDHCVKAKRACDFQFPCRTCSSRGTTCSYATANHDDGVKTPWQDDSLLLPDFLSDIPWINTDADYLDFASTSWNDFLSLNPANLSASTELHLAFLNNFTKNAGLVKSFDCGTPTLRQTAYEQYEQEAIAELSQILAEEPLATLSTSIITLIQEVTTCKPRNSAVDLTWSTATQELCADFFSPVELRRKIKMYWSIWHPNVNILHAPTFNTARANPALIAAMAVMGATVSPSESDCDSARVWFNTVEEIVFIDDDFCDDEPIAQFPTLRKIQALQAAYIVCLYQNWDGLDKAKRRVRRHRFNALVSAVRDIGIGKAKHPAYTNFENFLWTDFAAREQLIRVCHWVFLIDTAFVIFNNLPPHMVIKEMTCDLACCEGVFQAESAETCYQSISQKTEKQPFDSPKLSLALGQAAELLCKDDLSEKVLEQLANTGPLNLFAITSSLHSMLFQHQNSFNAQSQLVPLRNALENWKAIWTRYLLHYADTTDHAPMRGAIHLSNMWKRIGFVRYAADYWLLASLLLDKICVAEQRAAHSGLQNEPLQEQHNELVQPMLRKYDETSMQQVNQLISDFQRAAI